MNNIRLFLPDFIEHNQPGVLIPTLNFQNHHTPWLPREIADMVLSNWSQSDLWSSLFSSLALFWNSPHLIQYGLNVNMHLENGSTPLLTAVTDPYSSRYFVETLLKSRADPNRPSITGVIPLVVARKRKNTAVIDLLLKAGATASKKRRRRN